MNNSDFQQITLVQLNKLNYKVGVIEGSMLAYHKDSKNLGENWKKAKIFIPLSAAIPSVIAFFALI